MKRVTAIALLQFNLTLKSKGALLMMFAMPLIFIAIFALIAGGSGKPKPFPLAVIDADGSFASHELITALQQDESLQVQTSAASAVNLLLADRKISAGLVIPRGFQQAITVGSQPELQFITSPDSNLQLSVEPTVARAATMVAENYSLALQLSGGSTDAAKLRTVYGNVVFQRQSIQIGLTQSEAGSTVNQSRAQTRERAMGFTVMFVMMTVVMMGGVIQQERQNGLWGRILTTPMARAAVLGGYLLSFLLTGAFQFSLLVVASTLLFKVDWGPSLPLAAIALALIFCATGLGLFLSVLVRTADQQRIFGISLVIITSMLGGVYWPLDLMGSTLQKIGHLTPQAWAMDGLRVVMLHGANWESLAIPLTVLAGAAVVLMGASLLRLRSE